MSRDAVALIRPDALRHNLEILRKTAPGSRVIAVVKANAYGHGYGALAAALAGADTLGVACLDEAAALREAGVTRPIVLLEGIFSRDEIEPAAALGCELVVHADWQVEALEAVVASHAFVTWLKVDTGMNRLGFHPAQADAMHDRLGACSAVCEIRWMTHLACADAREHAMTRRQLESFRAVAGQRAGARSIANSAGVLAWPDTHADWVRPGLALYGVSPFAGEAGSAYGLEPVMTLTSRLIALRDLDVGDSVGYGADWQAETKTRIGIVGIGYGDGYPQHAPPQTPVRVNDRLVRLAGRVSMDMLAVDLGAGADDRVGDPVVLWGDGLPVETVAAATRTIPWTLLTAVSGRVQLVSV